MFQVEKLYVVCITHVRVGYELSFHEHTVQYQQRHLPGFKHVDDGIERIGIEAHGLIICIELCAYSSLVSAPVSKDFQNLSSLFTDVSGKGCKLCILSCPMDIGRLCRLAYTFFRSYYTGP